MTLERFQALLDAYGGDPKRWPEGERQAAQLFAESTAEARRLLGEARALDRFLDGAETAPATRALEDRILAGFPARGGSAPSSSGRWIPAAAVAASLALGLITGAALPGIAGIKAQDAKDPALVALGDIENDLWGDLEEGI